MSHAKETVTKGEACALAEKVATEPFRVVPGCQKWQYKYLTRHGWDLSPEGSYSEIVEMRRHRLSNFARKLMNLEPFASTAQFTGKRWQDFVLYENP